ncbi:MAG: GNAT family N-acetyltransferase [Bosea sp. (in: a-proteobacteria)]
MSLLERLFGRPRLRIEALIPAHAAQVSRLHGASFARGWDQPEVARMLSERNILSDGVFAGSSNSPSGFVMSRMAGDEAEILTICIDATRRGQGLGRMLLDQHIKNLLRRSVEQLFLEVEEHNVMALALYRRLGFVKVGERPGYYAKPDGSRALALVLRREIG